MFAFTMLNLDMSCFENIVDPDQLASEKPADQGPYCFFNSAFKYMLPGTQHVNWIKIGEKYGTYECSLSYVFQLSYRTN